MKSHSAEVPVGAELEDLTRRKLFLFAPSHHRYRRRFPQCSLISWLSLRPSYMRMVAGMLCCVLVGYLLTLLAGNESVRCRCGYCAQCGTLETCYASTWRRAGPTLSVPDFQYRLIPVSISIAVPYTLNHK